MNNTMAWQTLDTGDANDIKCKLICLRATYNKLPVKSPADLNTFSRPHKCLICWFNLRPLAWRKTESGSA